MDAPAYQELSQLTCATCKIHPLVAMNCGIGNGHVCWNLIAVICFVGVTVPVQMMNDLNRTAEEFDCEVHAFYSIFK